MGASCAPRKMAALGQQQDLRPTFHHCALHLYLINSGGAPSPFPNHPDWAPNVFAFKKANREAEEKKCDRYERTLKRKRCSESDGDAVASTLFLGDIEPDLTDGEDEMEPDSTGKQ
ncbi:hypothetical protein HPB49_004469 [Dermacentor silvarum]|uniref:Uncharacterized protein n=1 Tax=Dermacentor silvarum TaxID=543639 RepID=A0ACB8DUS0_DERSI|nr:hypothetical protein HPB49_004469 [Dermacentor silvarum]